MFSRLSLLNGEPNDATIPHRPDEGWHPLRCQGPVDAVRWEELLAEAIDLLDRWTTGDVTGFCDACRHIVTVRGGRTPDVLAGQPHIRDCPIGKFKRKVARALSAKPEQEAT